MATEILEIQPPELKFLFELKKQSSCSIQLSNKSDQYVAFKVKTTSPKKYCVRPNVGIINPKATCSFTVTMQAQRIAPPDMQCKDKFLIQNTLVPFGTSEEDITTDMFAKDSGKYIEEKKIKVVLVSATQSPVLLPINGEMKQDPYYNLSHPKERLVGGIENMRMPHTEPHDIGGLETIKDTLELKVVKDTESRSSKDVQELKPTKKVVKDMESILAKNEQEVKPVKGMEELKSLKSLEELKSAMDVEELKSIEGVEELKPAKDVEELKSVKDVAELKSVKYVQNLKPAKYVKELKLEKDVDRRSIDDAEELKAGNGMEKMNLAKAFQELKLKHDEVALKLREAELTIMKLTEERSLTARQKDKLTSQLEVLRNNTRKVQVGFPLLFVCMVALISLAVGYYILP